MKSLFESGLKKPMDGDTKYSRAIGVPQYEPSEVKPNLGDMYHTEKYRELMANINKSKVSEEEKEFLRLAATRHIVFTYSKIADYYAQASKEMQELMEESALVIIDMDDAIANGYVKLSAKMKQLIEEEKERDKNARDAKSVMKAQRKLLKEKLKEEESKEVKERMKKQAEEVKQSLLNSENTKDELNKAFEATDLAEEEGFMELPD